MREKLRLMMIILFVLPIWAGAEAEEPIEPNFSVSGGFYEEGQRLELSLPMGEAGTIRYTADGTMPTAQSLAYDAPIVLTDVSKTENRLSMRTDICWPEAQAPQDPVPKCTVIRAAVFDEKGSRGRVKTESYFVGEEMSSAFGDGMLCSLCIDPDDFFDYERGIYVNGAAFDKAVQEGGLPQDSWSVGNYVHRGREWERMAEVCFFDGGQPVVQGPVGVRIKGNYTRGFAQKSLNLFTRGSYGMKKLEYAFFDLTDADGHPVSSYDGITLRNGGNDHAFTMVRDSIHQQIIGEMLNCVQASRPCVVFLNGEFWGMYQLLEKQNDDYLHTHYGVDKDRIMMVKNGDAEEGPENAGAVWESEIKALAALDYVLKENRDVLEASVDVPQLLRYTAVQMWIGNFDWIRNIAMWKTTYTDADIPFADGRWRMLVFDTENGSGIPTNEAAGVEYDPFLNLDYGISRQRPLCELVGRMLGAEAYREQFASILLEIGNTVFDSGYVCDIISEWEDLYSPLILLTQERFHSENSPQEAEELLWGYFSDMRYFFEERFFWMIEFMTSKLGCSGELINIRLDSAESGCIDLSNKKYSDELDLLWLKDVPVYLKAVSGSGFHAVQWQADGGTLAVDGESAVFYPDSAECAVRYVFGD